MATDSRTVRERATYWFLLGGDRLLIAGVVAAATAALTLVLAWQDVITVGYDSSIRGLLSSGVTSGLLALVTVSLSINQLILSRVFGSPNELTDRYESNLQLRDEVEDLAGAASSPNDPAAFVAMIIDAVRDHATALADDAENADDERTRRILAAHAENVLTYADRVDEFDDADTGTSDVLMALLGGNYAQHVTGTRQLKKDPDVALTDGAEERLDAILDSLKAIAVTRQYLKTLAVQQELARLSRLVAYSGLAAILVTVYLTLVYRTGSGATLPPGLLTPVASAGFAVIVSPLAILITYTLRIATIARYTVSAGPFVPPEETLSS